MSPAKCSSALQTELSSKQITAVEALIIGSTDQEAANQAGVHRTTITRWRLHNPVFRAELNRQRAALWGASLDRLRSLLPSALDRLEEEIKKDGGDWKAAAKLLEIAGASGMAPVSPDAPTTAEAVLDEDISHRWTSILKGVVGLNGGGPDLDERRERMIEEYKAAGAFEKECRGTP